MFGQLRSMKESSKPTRALLLEPRVDGRTQTWFRQMGFGILSK